MRVALLFPLLLLALPAHAQWQILDSNTTADLRGIDNVGGGVVWASGSKGTVLRSEDAGYMWQTCPVPPGAEHLDFRGIQAFDNNTAIVMSSGKGDLSRLYKTTDGCQTWELLFTNPDKDGFWDAVKFSGRSNGMLLGDPVGGRFVVMGTLDGGLHWTRVETTDLAAPPQANVFAASNSSLMVPSAPSFVTGGPGGAYFYSGDNLCTMLTAQQSPQTCIREALRFERTRLPMNGNAPSAGGFSVGSSRTGLNGLVLVVVGGDYAKPAERTGTAAHFNSYFGGWFAAKALPRGYRSAVAYASQADAWITVGPNGTDISTDDGRNWRALKPDPQLHDAPDTDRNWNALSLPFAVGPHGRIGLLEPPALKTASH